MPGAGRPLPTSPCRDDGDVVIPADELTAMQETADSALPDTCTITRVSTTAATFDDDTGQYTTPTPTTVYSGACRLRSGGRTTRSDESGDRLVVVNEWTLTLPSDSAEVLVGDIVALADSDDPTIDDCRFRVAVVNPGSWLISRRLTVEEVLDRA